MFDLAGKSLGKVELPGKGTADGFGGDQDDKETFFVFTSYNVRRASIATMCWPNKIELIRQPKVKFDPDRFRRRASVLQKQRRHPRADDARLSQGFDKRASRTRRCSTATAATTSR